MIGRINNSYIQLKKSVITGNTNSTFASLKFEQEYRNTSSSVLNCQLDLDHLNTNYGTYVIYNIKIHLNGSIIKFKVRCNNKANDSHGQYYDSLSIGQIQPNSTFTITIECSFMAFSISENSIQFDFPFEENYANSQIECLITVIEKQPIKEISNIPYLTYIPNGKYSGIIKTTSPFECKSKISPIIEIKGKIKDESVCLKIGGDTFIGVSSCPSISQKKSNSEIVVLLDISGSMGGDRICIAKETLKQMVRRFPIGSYFNIIFFNDSKSEVFNSAVEYNTENMNIALERITNVSAGGGTTLYEPLQFSYDIPVREGYTRSIYVLTDGGVAYKEKCVEIIMKNRNNSKLFLIGIGHGVEIQALREMRDAGHGKLYEITDNSQISSIVLNQLSESLRMSVPNVNLKVLNNNNCEIAPFPIPPLFEKSLTHVFVRIPSKKPLKELKFESILGWNAPIVQLNGINYTSTMKSDCIPETKPIRLDKLFAFFSIHDLENSISVMPDKETLEALKNKVTLMSERFGIVSQFTSFWTEEENNSGETKKTQQKINYNQVELRNNFNAAVQKAPQKVTERSSNIPQLRMINPESEIANDDDDDDEGWFNFDLFFSYFLILLNFLMSLFFLILWFLTLPLRIVAYFVKLIYKIIDHLIIDWIRFYNRFKIDEENDPDHPDVPEGKYSMEAVINSQDIDGRWSADKLDWIMESMGSECHLSRYFAPSDDMQATAMALLLLKSHESEKENELNLIYKKGISWLKYYRNVDWKSIIEKKADSIEY